MNRLKTPELDELAEAAHTARSRAYVPYSHFAVGAAVRTPEGRIYSGANIENASYSLTMCAERIALYQALMDGATGISAIAVITPTSSVASPCGACRQVMYELAPGATVLLLSATGEHLLTTVEELLPHGFGKRQLSEERS